jgi:hypothetical protein
VVWRHLGLPDPTPLQLSIAWWLQHGPDRAIIEAFRGAAKSWITAAYVLWLLYCDPQKKVLVVSGSLKRAVAFTQFCLQLIREMPQLRWLEPKPNQRQASQAFDVGPATPDQTPSFMAAGVMSQTVGFRSDAIIPDDVETNTNSLTVLMREKIREAVKEYESIIKPGGAIKFLGTPHDYDSLYNYLSKRGYTIRIWPARYPNRADQRVYGDKLAPYILHCLRKDPSLVGQTVEPTRFTEEDLRRRELAMGKSEFRLQFMLDTSLSDTDRYPLKLANLMAMGLDHRRGPDLVAWGKSDDLVLRQLPSMGFDGDFFYAPASISPDFSDYTTVVGALDPSGGGKDETGLAIGAELHGILYLLYCNGWRQGSSPDTMREIARAIVRFRCHHLIIESNFGDGMYASLLRPFIEDEWRKANAPGPQTSPREEAGGTTVEDVRSGQTQKEIRILRILEPVTQGHRLVVNVECIEQDYESVRARDEDGEEAKHRYSLFYQMTHLTRERDSLPHDDRIESLAMLAGHFAEALGVSPENMARNRDEERIQDELEALFEDADEIGGHSRAAPATNSPANLRPGYAHRQRQ